MPIPQDFPCLRSHCDAGRIYARFIALLKPRFKFSPDDCATPEAEWGVELQPQQAAHNIGQGAIMGRTEFGTIDNGSMGEVSEDMFFRLGMMYSTGAEVPTDLVSAHKWFNIAAMKGNAEAARLRREIAVEMTETEIAQAQRAARDWLKH
jgi:hypothetical protein